MNLSNKKILITGADGFIGSHLTEYLVRKGYNVRAFVYYNSFGTWGWLDKLPLDLKNNFEVFSGDIRDPYGVKTAVKGCDVILHLAALIGIPYSYHSPAAYVDTNINGTLNIVQTAKELEIEKVIHTSTSEVYGTAKFVPITEDHPLQGQSPYSASKIAADQLALSFYHSFGTPVSIVRPFNTFGPRQSARAIIPTIITQIASGSRTLKLGSLHPTRDFTFVTDTVKAFIATAECDASIGQIINIGSNFEISMHDTAKLIASSWVKKSRLLSCPFTSGNSEVSRLWADNNKAKKLIDWETELAARFKKRFQKHQWFENLENIQLYKTSNYNIGKAMVHIQSIIQAIKKRLILIESGIA